MSVDTHLDLMVQSPLFQKVMSAVKATFNSMPTLNADKTILSVNGEQIFANRLGLLENGQHAQGLGYKCLSGHFDTSLDNILENIICYFDLVRNKDQQVYSAQRMAEICQNDLTPDELQLLTVEMGYKSVNLNLFNLLSSYVGYALTDELFAEITPEYRAELEQWFASFVLSAEEIKTLATHLRTDWNDALQFLAIAQDQEKIIEFKKAYPSKAIAIEAMLKKYEVALVA
jgi:hypothetical protein